MLIHRNLLKKNDLADLKSEINKLDIDKLEKAPSSLNNLKIKVDKLHVDKLVPVPTDLGNVNDVVKNEVVKKDAYDEFVEKVNVIDTSRLVEKTDYNAMTKDIEDKIPGITNLATTAAVTTVERKIPDFRNLVK